MHTANVQGFMNILATNPTGAQTLLVILLTLLELKVTK